MLLIQSPCSGMFQGEKMKPDKYNPKAREAFGKSLIDIGVAIFKGIILLVTVVPLTLFAKSAFESNGSSISVFKILGSISNETLGSLMGLILVAYFAGHYFRKEGLRHIHELEIDRP